MTIGIADAVKALGEWLNGQKYSPTGQLCPNCKHYEKYRRFVGAPIGGHYQESCACRLSRMKGFDISCGCEWTQDIPSSSGNSGGGSGGGGGGGNQGDRGGGLGKGHI